MLILFFLIFVGMLRVCILLMSGFGVSDVGLVGIIIFFGMIVLVLVGVGVLFFLRSL